MKRSKRDGLVIGAIVLIVLIVCIVVAIQKRRKDKDLQAKAELGMARASAKRSAKERIMEKYQHNDKSTDLVLQVLGSIFSMKAAMTIKLESAGPLARDLARGVYREEADRCAVLVSLFESEGRSVGKGELEFAILSTLAFALLIAAQIRLRDGNPMTPRELEEAGLPKEAVPLNTCVAVERHRPEATRLSLPELWAALIYCWPSLASAHVIGLPVIRLDNGSVLHFSPSGMRGAVSWLARRPRLCLPGDTRSPSPTMQAAFLGFAIGLLTRSPRDEPGKQTFFSAKQLESLQPMLTEQGGDATIAFAALCYTVIEADDESWITQADPHALEQLMRIVLYPAIMWADFRSIQAPVEGAPASECRWEEFFWEAALSDSSRELLDRLQVVRADAEGETGGELVRRHWDCSPKHGSAENHGGARLVLADELLGDCLADQLGGRTFMRPGSGDPRDGQLQLSMEQVGILFRGVRDDSVQACASSEAGLLARLLAFLGEGWREHGQRLPMLAGRRLSPWEVVELVIWAWPLLQEQQVFSQELGRVLADHTSPRIASLADSKETQLPLDVNVLVQGERFVCAEGRDVADLWNALPDEPALQRLFQEALLKAHEASQDDGRQEPFRRAFWHAVNQS